MKTPLKLILKNFLDHVEDLEKRKNLNDDQYELEFQELKKLTDKLRDDSTYSCSCGLKDVNRPKNRYKDIVPYDFSRVILPKHEGVPGSDYINASYVKGASGAFAYIAAQGPLPNTVIDFWRMIWVCDVQVIVMACNEREAGKFKCEAYWPQPGEIKAYGNISIELINTAQMCPDFLIRTLLVKCGNEMRDVYQFHYTSWPDHGIPDSVQPILDLVRLMRDCQATETVPIVIHCSAGCGRTGTICAVDYVWACLRQGKLDEDFSLYRIAQDLRKQRIAMIQTKEQYILAHKVVATMFEQQLKVIDCHIYENVDEDGEPLVWKEVRKNKDVDDISLNMKQKIENKQMLLSSLKNGSFECSSENSEKTQAVSNNISSQDSSDSLINKNSSENIISSSKHSDSSYSCNSILSQQNNDDSIPFIDEDEVCIRPNCGRAYLNIPSCNSISKLINAFDPFVDKVSSGTDDSSPEGDPNKISNRINDFQLTPENTINKVTEPKTSVRTKELDSKSDIVSYPDKTKNSTLFNNRESYPSYNTRRNTTNDTKTEDCEKPEELKSNKKVGKATVVRRPSISKLKALFEKSGISQKSADGSKRLLFRNNSHHVSRAGSAPPSLKSMDNDSELEKQSILMMVTRKFRSSSVRTERELQSEQCSRTLNRKSATETVKDGLNALTRTVSFSLNKTFKSYSPAKPKVEIKNSMDNPSSRIIGTYKPKSPDSDKGNSMWYDRTSLPRAVAIVKPTGNFETNSAPKIPPKSPLTPSYADKDKTETHFSFSNKPAKLRELFNSLNRKDPKESATFWINEGINDDIDTEKDIYKSSKVLPFLPSNPFKKVNMKSPLSSPDSPKENNELYMQQNSKFYTDINDSSPETILEVKPIPKVPECPVPEEIIPLHPEPPSESFWPSQNSKNSELPKLEYGTETSLETNSSPPQNNDSERVLDSEPEENNTNEDMVKDMPPAIPKKMLIGKGKSFQNSLIEANTESQTHPIEKLVDTTEKATNFSPINDNHVKDSVAEEKSDVYMNVNMKAKKNIEQIENTIRKNPRAAIIDLTSRKSYSMEEELVNAVNQLSESTGENKSSPSYLTKTSDTGDKVGTPKMNPKFPGYEVIWPESSVPVQKSNSSSKIVHNQRSKLPGNYVNLPQKQNGLCYSPPLRRSMNANLLIAKSQSCGSLDWLEPDDAISGFVALKEQSNTPTKRLVNEAVVELNTLLNQLTTRTLSEDIEFKSKSKENLVEDKKVDSKKDVSSSVNLEPNDTVVDSVTLVTKSYSSGKSPKEEEIVFHFPPPPKVPPPKDGQTVESFEILRKNGALVVKEKSTDENKSNAGSNIDAKTKGSSEVPQPAPRKSKQSSPLRRSSSYSNISPPQSKNKGYENIFLEKYQTLSRLQIKPETGDCAVLDKPLPMQKPALKHKPDVKKLPHYVNISDTSKSGELNLSNIIVQPTKHAGNVKLNYGSPQIDTNNTNEENSNYGKIHKFLDKPQLVKHENLYTSKNLLEEKKKIPSKKTERAPAPPNLKIFQTKPSDKKESLIPKKLPSRKLEKAPPPPHLLQKSSSSIIVPKQKLQTTQQFSNLSFQDENKSKLPAVHENVPNSVQTTKMDKNTKSVFVDKFVGRGLSHSQSDVSVFLALKERKARSAVQGHKVINMKSLLMNRKPAQNNELVNVSSSDSDSSYEKIFLTNKEKECPSKTIPQEQISNISPRVYKKEMPVAPPRSKRRSTTEVQYAQVKAKDASLNSTSQITSGDNMTKDSKSNPATKVDVPPAIPLKTKDTFEVLKD